MSRRKPMGLLTPNIPRKVRREQRGTELQQHPLIALRHQLNPAIRAVHDVTGNGKVARNLGRRITKSHPLHMALKLHLEATTHGTIFGMRRA